MNNPADGLMHGRGNPIRSALELAEASDWNALHRLISTTPDRAYEVDDFGMMPIHWSCTDRDVPLYVIKKLLEANPQAVVCKNKGGLVPIHIAVKAKVALNVLQALVAINDETLCLETPTGETPAELAVLCKLSSNAQKYLVSVYQELQVAGRAPSRPSRIHTSETTLAQHPTKDAKTGITLPTTPARWKMDKRCRICQLKFSYFKSRHHCRNCGESVCDTHSKHKLPLPHIGMHEPQRICIMCYDELRDQGEPPTAVANMYSNIDRLRQHHSELPTPKLQFRDSLGMTGLPHSHSAHIFDELQYNQTSSPMTLNEVNGHIDDEVDRRNRSRTELTAGEKAKYSEMQQQVRELQLHVQELQASKDRVNLQLQLATNNMHRSISDIHTNETNLEKLRVTFQNSIDVRKVPFDDNDPLDEDIFEQVLREERLGIQQMTLGRHEPEEELESAVVAVNDFNEIDDEHDPASFDVAATCYHLGMTYYEKKDFSNAIIEFRKSVAINRKDPDVWYNLALALNSSEDYYNAEIAVRRSLAIKQKNYSALSLLGKILHGKGEHEKSIDAFQQALLLMNHNEDSDSDEDVGSLTVGW